MNDRLLNRKSFNIDRLFPTLFGTAIFLHLLLLWHSPILPFIDLPFRLAASTIVRYFGDANQFSQYYAVEAFLKPNSFHLFFCSLKIFPSVEFANKVFYSLYMILLPCSVLLTIRKTGGNRWFALLSFLLLYNFSLSWGFSEFTLAIPVVLFLFYFSLDHFRGGGFFPLISVTFLLMLLFFIHVVALLFALFMFGVLGLYYCRKSLLKLLKKGLVVLPVLLLILLWWKSDASQDSQFSLSYLWFYFKNYWLEGLWLDRLNLPAWDNYSLFPGMKGKLIAFFFSLVIILPVLIDKWTNSSSAKQIAGGQNLTGEKKVTNERNSIYIFLGCAFFFYLIMPHKIADNFHLFQRFAVFVFLGIVILDGWVFGGKKKLNTVLVLSMVAVFLLHFVLWAGYLSDFKKETRSFTKDLFAADDPGEKKLAGLIYDFSFRGRPIYIHFPNYYITWKQGIASTCLIDYRFGTIRRKASKTSLPPHRRIEWIGKRGAYDGRFGHMDYILVRGEIPDEHRIYMKNFTLKRSSGKWSLYERSAVTGREATTEGDKDNAAGLVAEFSLRSDEPYLWSRLTRGTNLYFDRYYTYTSVPSRLEGQPVLIPANNDKYYDYNEKDFPFISFRVKRDVTVYIIYTKRFTNLEKTWLNRENGWIKENFIVRTGQVKWKSARQVCSRFYPAGSVVELGGNGCQKRDCDMYTVVVCLRRPGGSFEKPPPGPPQNFCRRPHICGAEMARSAFRKSFCGAFFKKRLPEGPAEAKTVFYLTKVIRVISAGAW